jgi:uncharacterized lipoprotein YmbA
VTIQRASLPVLFLLLTGCGLSRPHPPKAFFVLPSVALEPVSTDARVPVRLVAAEPSPPFDSRMFQYRVGEAQYEPAYYAQWAADPGALLVDAFARAFDSAGGVLVIGDAGATDSPTLRLRITELYADVREPTAPLAILACKATLISPSGRVLMTRAIRTERPSESKEPTSLVEAWAEGVGEAARDLLPSLHDALDASAG